MLLYDAYIAHFCGLFFKIESIFGVRDANFIYFMSTYWSSYSKCVEHFPKVSLEQNDEWIRLTAIFSKLAVFSVTHSHKSFLS